MSNYENEPNVKKVFSMESLIFSICFVGFFFLISNKMGIVNALNTMMNTSYDLLLNTVFYIMSIAVLTGAIASIFSEFGIVAIINYILSPLMKPIYGLPGASAIGVLTTYLSDNPAILTLATDSGFSKMFKKYQLVALTNIGTAFGMGLIITTFMLSLTSPIGESFGFAVLAGNLGAVIGSIVSTRIMLKFSKKHYGDDDTSSKNTAIDYRITREGNAGTRFVDALLSGGKNGVDMGLAIIPGVLIICTIVLLLTNGEPTSGYTGSAYEGIGILPYFGSKINFILQPLFGFSSPEALAVPITSLGAAGAAIGLVPALLENGLVKANDIAVFTAMCMCWSGYLSTHVAMMDGLNAREMTGKAIFSHTIAGFCAGIGANFLFKLFTLI